MKDKKLKKVYWRDITASKEWQTLEEALTWGKKEFEREYITAGYIIYQDKDFLLIAGTISDDEMYNDISMIMRNVLILII